MMNTHTPNPGDTYRVDGYDVTVVAVNVPGGRIGYQTRRLIDGHVGGYRVTTLKAFARLVERAQ